MAKRRKTLIAWSGGKDSALSLFELKSPDYDVVGLWTTVIEGKNRTQAHDIRIDLIEAQALSIGLPLHKVFVPELASNDVYEERVGKFLKEQKEAGIECIAFGDLHLEDIKKYRETQLKKWKLKPVFPLWGWDGGQVLQAMTGLGYKAVVHCIDKQKVPEKLVGAFYGPEFCRHLPQSIDKAGENGEFHTFVSAGLFFELPIHLEAGQKYENGSYLYLDLKLSGSKN